MWIYLALDNSEVRGELPLLSAASFCTPAVAGPPRPAPLPQLHLQAQGAALSLSPTFSSTVDLIQAKPNPFSHHSQPLENGDGSTGHARYIHVPADWLHQKFLVHRRRSLSQSPSPQLANEPRSWQRIHWILHSILASTH